MNKYECYKSKTVWSVPSVNNASNTIPLIALRKYSYLIYVPTETIWHN